MSKKNHMFDSKAQMRWAFATHQSFAKRWGEATELAGKSKRLPARKRVKSARSILTGRAGR